MPPKRKANYVESSLLPPYENWGTLATAATTIGLLRKILCIIVILEYGNSSTAMMTAIGLSESLNFIQYQINFYRNFNRWDPVIYTSGVDRLRGSSIRAKIVEVYNSLPFPVKVHELKQKLLEVGVKIKRHRLLEYAGSMGFQCRTTKKVTNASNPTTCVERCQRGGEMLKEILALKKQKGAKWYYYDQACLNQYVIMNDEVLVPSGLVVYEPERSSIRSTSITLHLMVDETGRVVHYRCVQSGQGKEEITSFLNECAGKLPKETPPIIYMDHLGTHQGLFKKQIGKKSIRYEVRLTPKSCPEVDICEQVFHSVQAYFRRNITGNLETLTATEWIQLSNKYVRGWFQQYKESSDLLEHTIQYLRKLVKSGGDLQKIALAEVKLKSVDDVKLKCLPCDAEYATINDD